MEEHEYQKKIIWFANGNLYVLVIAMTVTIWPETQAAGTTERYAFKTETDSAWIFRVERQSAVLI